MTRKAAFLLTWYFACAVLLIVVMIIKHTWWPERDPQAEAPAFILPVIYFFLLLYHIAFLLWVYTVKTIHDRFYRWWTIVQLALILAFGVLFPWIELDMYALIL